MPSKPRVHHFVPQFWIKNFRAHDGLLWAYDWKDDAVKDRSPKTVMQVRDLYTVQPSGVDDTTLETVDNMKIDNDGAALFSRIVSGGRGQGDKEELAEFLAVQALRDPEIIAMYNPSAQMLVLALSLISHSTSYSAFASALQEAFPGTVMSEAEYDHLKSLGSDEFRKVYFALEDREGLPELPFTDLVRRPEGRNIVRSKMLSLQWTLKESVGAHYVLGDRAIAYEIGDLTSLRVPLTSSVALYMTEQPVRPGIDVASARDDEVDALNFESAALARRWLVGEPTSLAPLKAQVEKNSFLV